MTLDLSVRYRCKLSRKKHKTWEGDGKLWSDMTWTDIVDAFIYMMHQLCSLSKRERSF